MAKRLLSVGNCSYDFGNLSTTLQKHFAIELQNVDTAEEADEVLKKQSFDLILVNRLFDVNQDSGIAFIKRHKAAQLATPMMLLSNFPEYQEEAQAVGAVKGFGKNQVKQPIAVELLKPYLS
jgi:two-component SAPR family response regulator